MKNLKFWLLYCLLVYQLGESAIAQNLHAKNVDEQALHSYITASNKQLNEYERKLFILFSSKDCASCNISTKPLVADVMSSNSSSQTKIIVVTDAVSYAKKNFKKYSDKIIFIYAAEIFDKFNLNNLSFVYLESNNKLYSSITDIRKQLFGISSPKIKPFKDNALTSDYIQSSDLPYNHAIVFDFKMQEAILFKNFSNFKKDSISYDTEKLETTLTDSLKIFNLPDRLGTLPLSKLSLREYNSLSSINANPLVTLYSIIRWENWVYITFSLDRLYKEKDTKDSYRLLGNSYLAIKEIKSEADFKSILDIGSYNNYFLVDVFNFQGRRFPTSTWIYYVPEISSKAVVKMRVNLLNLEETEMEYSGMATIQLDFEKNKSEILEIDKTAANIRMRHNRIEILKNYYLVEKVVTNPAENEGNIIFTAHP